MSYPKSNTPFRNIPENGIIFPPQELGDTQETPNILNKTAHFTGSQKNKSGQIYKWRDYFNFFNPRDKIKLHIQPWHEVCKRAPELADRTVIATLYTINPEKQLINFSIKVSNAYGLSREMSIHFYVVFDESMAEFDSMNCVRIFGKVKNLK